MKRIFALYLFIWNVGCTTTTEPVATVPEPAAPRPQSVSISELKDRLKMNRSLHDMGFREAKYDPKGYLITIHFRMLCRQSEGTVDEVAHADLSPIFADNIEWKLGRYFSGSTETDRDGYGKVELISTSSGVRERLRLTRDGKFVAVPANEAGLVVVPGGWCQH